MKATLLLLCVHIEIITTITPPWYDADFCITRSFLYTYCWGFTRLGQKQKEVVKLRKGKYVGSTWGQLLSRSIRKAEIYLHQYANHLFCLFVCLFQGLYQEKSSFFFRCHAQKHNNNILELTMGIWLLLKFNTYTWWKSKFRNILY